MQNQDYRYQLGSRHLTGRRQQKAICPQCGRRSLVRYVDTQRNFAYIDNIVGRCDHEQSCGYHLKPSEYYHDHPREERWQQPITVKPPAPKPFIPLPMAYVERSHSRESTFWQWYEQTMTMLGIAPETISKIYEDYRIGATRRREVIFWQIDQWQRVHGGHVMAYRRDGHREGYQGWTHLPLIQEGVLPLDYQLHQCLFGEHLLATRPEVTVCLVESEKTALLMAALQPEHLWLATSGSNGLNEEKLRCLKGRRVVVFPDSGCYEKWKKLLDAIPGLQFNISADLEQYPPNTDLADLIL